MEKGDVETKLFLCDIFFVLTPLYARSVGGWAGHGHLITLPRSIEFRPCEKNEAEGKLNAADHQCQQSVDQGPARVA